MDHGAVFMASRQGQTGPRAGIVQQVAHQAGHLIGKSPSERSKPSAPQAFNAFRTQIGRTVKMPGGPDDRLPGHTLRERVNHVYGGHPIRYSALQFLGSTQGNIK